MPGEVDQSFRRMFYHRAARASPDILARDEHLRGVVTAAADAMRDMGVRSRLERLDA